MLMLMMMMMTVVRNESPLGLGAPNETVDSAVRHHIDDDTSQDEDDNDHHHDYDDEESKSGDRNIAFPPTMSPLYVQRSSPKVTLNAHRY